MLNKVELMGRMVANPQLKHTSNNILVTNFCVAVQRSYKPGEEREADFIDCVAWRKTAEFICRNFRKGQFVILVGSLQQRFYEDKNGISRKATEVIVDECYFGGDGAKRTGDPENVPPPDDDITYIPIEDDGDLPF